MLQGTPSVDAQGRLLCGAAVGTREGDKERVAALVKVGSGLLGRCLGVELSYSMQQLCCLLKKTAQGMQGSELCYKLNCAFAREVER